MNKIRIAVFEDRAQAERARERLSTAGVPAQIHEGFNVAKLWFVSKRRAGVRLEVAASDAERARQHLVQWDATEGLLRNAFRCPECLSLRVDYPQFTEKSIFTNVAFGLMAELGFIEREYYCHDCHYMWTRPADKSRRVRLHMAPDYFLEDLSPSLPLQPEAAPSRASARTRRRHKPFHRTDCAAAVSRTRAHPQARWSIEFTLIALSFGLLAASCVSL